MKGGLIAFGILAGLLVAVMAYANWRLVRMANRSGYHRAGLSSLYPRDRPWQELSPWMRALRVSMLICFAVAMISMSTVGAIETAALRQPKIADAPFVHPREIKGGVRFFTDRQNLACSIPCCAVGWNYVGLGGSRRRRRGAPQRRRRCRRRTTRQRSLVCSGRTSGCVWSATF
jgi:hypothetical protein